MKNLSHADRTTIDRVRADVSNAIGSRIQSIALCGDAATADYRAGRSPLSFALVLDRVDPDALAALRPHVGRWRRRRVATPLLFDRDYLRNAIDVFPLELLDLRDRHLHLEGDEDPFAGLAIVSSRLHRELEEQLRGKMLHLWESRLETASLRRLRDILLDSLPFFFVLLRGMAFLFDRSRPAASIDVLREVEVACGVKLSCVAELEAARTGRARLAVRDVESAFAAYLEEVRALVTIVDSSEAG